MKGAPTKHTAATQATPASKPAPAPSATEPTTSTATASAPGNDAPPDASTRSESGAADVAAQCTGTPPPEVVARIQTVLNLLTPEERDRVMELTRRLPVTIVEQAQEKMLTVTLEEAASYLRAFLASNSAGSTAGSPGLRAA